MLAKNLPPISHSQTPPLPQAAKITPFLAAFDDLKPRPIYAILLLGKNTRSILARHLRKDQSASHHKQASISAFPAPSPLPPKNWAPLIPDVSAQAEAAAKRHVPFLGISEQSPRQVGVPHTSVCGPAIRFRSFFQKTNKIHLH